MRCLTLEKSFAIGTVLSHLLAKLISIWDPASSYKWWLCEAQPTCCSFLASASSSEATPEEE